jgi:hypothetical protein
MEGRKRTAERLDLSAVSSSQPAGERAHADAARLIVTRIA